MNELNIKPGRFMRQERMRRIYAAGIIHSIIAAIRGLRRAGHGNATD